MKLQETLQQVIDRWHLEQSRQEMENISQEPGIKIGFIGKFSSGKTSLINCLLGTHFPVNINPTTKTVCIIEPCQGITENKYYEEKRGLSRVEVDFDSFVNLCSGEEAGIVVAQVPPSPILPEGCVFVDTPGIDSLKAEDKEITYSYLAFLDAAVLCVNINEGTLNEDVQRFLLDEKLVVLHNRVVVALTHCDMMRDPAKQEAVTQEVLKQLNTWKNEGKFKAFSLENKIMLVNSNDVKSCQEMFLAMQKHFTGKREEIYAQRRQEAYCQLAKEVLETLKELKNEIYDNKEIESQKHNISKEIESIESLVQQKRADFQHLGEEIEKAGQVIADGYANMLANVSAEEEEKIASQLEEEIHQMCQQKVQAFLADFTLPSHICKKLSGGIKQRIQVNDSMWAAGKIALVAAVVAATGGAAGVAGNAAEAAGGAVAAKKGADLAKQAARKTAKNLAENAAQQKGFFGRLFECVGETINEANPLTHVERAFGPSMKEKMIRSFIISQNIRIVDVITEMIWNPYQEKIIDPVLRQLEDKKSCLEKLKQEEENNFNQYIKNKETLGRDISLLEKEISND